MEASQKFSCMKEFKQTSGSTDRISSFTTKKEKDVRWKIMSGDRERKYNSTEIQDCYILTWTVRLSIDLSAVTPN